MKKLKFRRKNHVFCITGKGGHGEDIRGVQFTIVDGWKRELGNLYLAINETYGYMTFREDEIELCKNRKENQ